MNINILCGGTISYIRNHGPNIVFNKNIDPNKVIDFIDKNFDLSKSTSELNYEF